MIFGVKTRSDVKVLKCLDMIRNNFNDNSTAKFFISSFKVRTYRVNNFFFTVFDIRLGLPPFYYLGFLFLVLAFLWRPFFYFSLLFLLSFFFFSRLWFTYVFFLALRRRGYKGFVKLLGDGPALRGVVFESNRSV